MNVRSTLSVALCAGGLLSALADGGEKGLFPIFVVDPDTDQVYRGIDDDGDGAYVSAGEMIVFYDDTLGPVALDGASSIHTSPNDYLYVGDRALRRIVAMEDLDDDGDCHDVVLGVPEALVYFEESTSLSGVGMADVRGIHVATLGETWVASSNTLVSENDAILVLQDLNADLDANDALEAREYHVIAPGGAVGDSVPTAVIRHPDGFVYYLENSTTGVVPKGVYRLEDTNTNGVIDAPGEVFAFWIPGSTVGMDLVALDVDEAGIVYVGDRGNAAIVRLEDADSSGTIVGAEACAWFDAISAFTSHDLTVSNDGHEVVALFDEAPDGMLLLEDGDDDCFVDPSSEVLPIYDDVAGDTPWTSASGVDLDFHGHEEVGKPFCFGIKGRCPCGNDGEIPTGCANSTGGGATLEGEETASVSLDDLVFHLEGLPNGTTTIMFYGSQAMNGGLGVHFADGLLCVTSQVRRMGSRVATGGQAMFGPGLAAIHGWAPGETRYFQGWFRNIPGPCGNLANTTNGLEITFER